MEWISIKNALPMRTDYILVWHADDDGDFMASCAVYNGIVKNKAVFLGDGGVTLKQVTHWMYLPEAPKEQA